MSTKLSQAILDEGILSVDFFNGRLLSAEDLRQERAANRTIQKFLAKAAGNGVAYGFEVVEKTNSVSDPAVTVKPGLALSRSGLTLWLKTETDLSLLDPSIGGGAAQPAGFRACGATSGGTYVGADGAYLLVVSPAQGKQGSAPVSGLGTGTASCNSRYNVDGVMFRLLRLDIAASDLADANRVRSLVAHRCFGTAELAGNPFAAPSLEDYGALALLRPASLTDCDVPLAVVLWSGSTGIRYVDLWAVRRRVTRLFPGDRYVSYLGDRRAAEGEAIFLQFQAHLADLLRAGGSFTAEQRFRYLPAAGYLPGSMDWRAFLGPITRGAITPMRRTVMRSILHESLLQDPVLLTENPPLPVNVYQDPARTEFILFARTKLGRLQVSTTPAAQSVTARARSVSTGLVYGLKSESSVFPPSVDVPPGPYRLSVDAPGFLPFEATADTTAIGAQTVNLTATLQPLPNAQVAVQVINARTGADVTSTMSSVTAAGAASLTAAYQAQANRWRFTEVPMGQYTIRVVGAGYQTASQTLTVSQPGATMDVRIEAVPAAMAAKPRQCFDYRAPLKTEKLGYRVCMVEKGIFLPDRRKLEIKGDVPWEQMEPLENLPKEMEEWLAEWRKYLARTYDRYGVEGARPAVYAGKTFAPLKVKADVPETPRAWAVFGEVGIPLLVTSLSQSTRAPVTIAQAKIPGLKPKYVETLKEYGIATIDQLAGAWTELVEEATGESTEYAYYLIADAAQSAATINQKRGYLVDVDEKTQESLRKLGYTDDVALANADLDRLAAEIGEGFAYRLIQQAREIVNQGAWSLDALGLSQGQKEQLQKRGVDSLGMFAARASTDEGRREVARTILDRAGSAEIDQVNTLRATALSKIAEGQAGG